MRKPLLLMIATLLSYNVLAWNIKIINNSDGEVYTEFNYDGEGICALDKGTIPGRQANGQPGETNWDAKICCAKDFWFRKTGGTNIGSGFKIERAIHNCVNHKIVIQQNADGSIYGNREIYY
jgi:hypothetical protein